MKRNKRQKMIRLKMQKQMKEHFADEEYILTRIWNDFEIVEFISPELLKNKKFMTKVVQINGMALQYALKELRDDKQFVMMAVQNSSGFALKYASKRLRADREIVYEAVKRWKSPLKYASQELQDEINKIIDDYYSKHDI